MTDSRKNQVLSRMQRYCSLEDRSVQKIREKLMRTEGLTAAEKEDIISSLVEDDFLNEKRFVESFVRSKVNQKRWGIRKIREGLYRHRIPPDLINDGLAQIDAEKYLGNLTHLLSAKQKNSQDPAAWIRYLAQKGYEYEDILEAIEGSPG